MEKLNLSEEEKHKFLEIIQNHPIKDAAKIIGVTRQTIYNYMTALGIKPFKGKGKKPFLKNKLKNL